MAAHTNCALPQTRPWDSILNTERGKVLIYTRRKEGAGMALLFPTPPRKQLAAGRILAARGSSGRAWWSEEGSAPPARVQLRGGTRESSAKNNKK